MDIAVDTHGHQGMPVLHFDLGDVADVDIGDAYPGVRLNDDDIGQLCLNGVRALTVAFGSRQAERVEALPATPRHRAQQRNDKHPSQYPPQGVPPGGAGAAAGTIKPGSPWRGSADRVVVATGGALPVASAWGDVGVAVASLAPGAPGGPA